MASDEVTVLEIINVIASTATPILILVLTGIGWFIGRRIEKQTELEKQRLEAQREYELYLRDLQEKLRPERIDVYNTVLTPFIIALVKDEAIAQEKSFRNKTKEEVLNSIILSLDYKKPASSWRLWDQTMLCNPSIS